MNELQRKVKEENVRWITKASSEFLRLMLSFASTDDARPVLTMLYIHEGHALTADGYRLLSAPVPEELKDLEDGAYEIPKIRAGEGYIQVIKHEGEMFDNMVENILKLLKEIKTKKAVAKAPINLILIKSLLRASKYMQGAMFSIYEKGTPTLITNVAPNEQEFEAVIMPLHVAEDK